MICPACKKPALVSETRSEHARAILEDADHAARDHTQKAQRAAGEKVSPIEVVEDHPHPNLTNPDGSPIQMKGNGDDVHLVCENCGWVGNWTRPDAQG